jgi:4-hydroxybenzoate polyprenyltransferase
MGAMCSAALVCRLLDVWPLPWLAISMLGAVVLLIYTVDHLCDVQRMPVKPVTGRHLFHWRYKRELQVFAGILSLFIGLAVLVFLSVRLIMFGTILGSLVLVYLWLVHTLKSGQARKWFHKEVCIAFVYTAGVWGIGCVQATYLFPVHLLLAFAFGLVVLQNLFLFSWYELTEDIRQQQRSVVRTMGKKTARRVLWSLFIVFAVNACLLLLISDDCFIHQVLLGFGMMSGILAMLFLFPHLFRKNYRYRLMGDAVFFIPGGLLLNHLLFA